MSEYPKKIWESVGQRIVVTQLGNNLGIACEELDDSEPDALGDSVCFWRKCDYTSLTPHDMVAKALLDMRSQIDAALAKDEEE